MKFNTRVIQVVEMTREEEDRIWGNFEEYKKHGIQFWNTNDGNNEILFIGEDVYRPVCIVEEG